MFITSAEVGVYSAIQSYILPIRRSHMRLSSLWRETPLRRTHPPPLGPPGSTKPHGAKILARKRERAARRNGEMRIMWATCSAAVFLLGEIGNYFEGDVIDEAYTYLYQWITQWPESRLGSARGRPRSSHAGPGSSHRAHHDNNRYLMNSLRHLSFDTEDPISRPAPHDPAVLMNSHRLFLTSLCQSLLITDVPFTTEIRELFRNIDTLVALVQRLQSMQESLDLEEDEGVVDPMGDFAKQEVEVKKELGRARKRVDAGLRGIVSRLKTIDQDSETVIEDGLEKEAGIFVPWRGGGIERLLMRIEGGRKVDDDNQEPRRGKG
jgi:hypothetical protein